MLRVLLIDDSQIFTASLSMSLEVLDNVKVVGVCHSGEQAVSFVLQNEVDIVVLDFTMPGMNGLETARLLRAAHPDLYIIMATLSSSSIPQQSINRGEIQHLVQKEDLFQVLPKLLDEYRLHSGGGS